MNFGLSYHIKLFLMLLVDSVTFNCSVVVTRAKITGVVEMTSGPRTAPLLGRRARKKLPSSRRKIQTQLSVQRQDLKRQKLLKNGSEIPTCSFDIKSSYNPLTRNSSSI